MNSFNLKKARGLIAPLVVMALCSSAMADSSGQHRAMPVPAMPTPAMPMHGDHAQPAHTSDTLTATVNASGIIKAILLNTRQLKVQHDPIVEWHMGSMQMKFQLAADIDISSVKVGQQIRFTLHQQGIGKYVITELH